MTNTNTTTPSTSTDPYKSDAVLNQMKTLYQAATTDDERAQAVDQLVIQLDKTKSSVIGKLGALKVYKAKQRTTKAGGKIVRKWELVDQIVDASGLNLTDAEADSLGKATKDTLLKILALFEDEVAGDEVEKSNA